MLPVLFQGILPILCCAGWWELHCREDLPYGYALPWWQQVRWKDAVLHVAMTQTGWKVEGLILSYTKCRSGTGSQTSLSGTCSAPLVLVPPAWWHPGPHPPGRGDGPAEPHLQAVTGITGAQHRVVTAGVGELEGASQPPEKGAGEGCLEFTFCLLMTSWMINDKIILGVWIFQACSIKILPRILPREVVNIRILPACA